MTHAEHQSHIQYQADGGDGGRLCGSHANRVAQIGRQVGEHRVEADRVEHAGTEADDQSLEVVLEQLAQRGDALSGGSELLLVVQSFGHGSIHRRISELGTDEMHDQTKRAGHEERNTPSPRGQCIRAQRSGHHGGERGAYEQTDGGGCRNQRAVDATLLGRRVFAKEGCGAGIFTGSGEALHHAKQQQQCRSENADRSI